MPANPIEGGIRTAFAAVQIPFILTMKAKTFYPRGACVGAKVHELEESHKSFQYVGGYGVFYRARRSIRLLRLHGKHLR